MARRFAKAVGLAALAAVLAAATGCKSRDKPPQASTEPSETAAPAAQEPAPAITWKVSETQIGPLSATANPHRQLAELLPGYQVERTTRRAEGDTYDVFTVRESGDVIAVVEPANGAGIGAVEVRTARIAVEGAPPVGSLLRDAGSGLDCFAGVEEARYIYCWSPARSHVAYLIETSQTRLLRRDGGLVPGSRVSTADVSDRPIVAIRWTPASAADLASAATSITTARLILATATETVAAGRWTTPGADVAVAPQLTPRPGGARARVTASHDGKTYELHRCELDATRQARVEVTIDDAGHLHILCVVPAKGSEPGAIEGARVVWNDDAARAAVNAEYGGDATLDITTLDLDEE